MRRLRLIERKFAKEPIFHQRYLEFMQEYEDMGHMELIPENNDDIIVNYLPHHEIIREESATTKFRVVLDVI